MLAGRYDFPYTPNMGVTPMMPGMFWGGGMWIFPIIGLVVLLFVIYFVFTRVFPGGGTAGRSGGEQSPLDILKTRYAKGEISREEFERMKKDVTENGGTRNR